MPVILIPPVDAPIVRPFVYAGSPFAPGLHRGVDFEPRPGAVVRAPCDGRLVWAGNSAVTLLCGGRRVTLVDFVPAVGGDAVSAGEPVGRAGPEPLHLAVRRPDDPFGYEDPESHLAAAPGGPPPVTPRAPRAPRPQLRPPRAGPQPAPPRPPPAPRAPAALAPPLAWAGLAVLLLGASGGTTVHLRARARARAPKPALADRH